MIRVTEKYYIKKVNKIGSNYYGSQQRKRTIYWLLFIIPVFIKDEVIKGDWEN